jgi:hypothetical protein
MFQTSISRGVYPAMVQCGMASAQILADFEDLEQGHSRGSRLCGTLSKAEHIDSVAA